MSFSAFGQNVDMTASITDSPDPVTAGVDDIVYTAVLTNGTSGVSAVSPSLTVTIPASATIAGMSANNLGSCSGSVPTITCTWPDFAGYAQRTATITVTPGSGGTYSTTASAFATNETNTANNSATTTTTVNATIDLAVYSVSDNVNDITLGQGNVTYTINTYNYSSTKSTNPVLTVNLPASSTYVSHSVANGGTCTASGTALTCTWLVQNSGASFYTSVTVTPGAGGTNTLTASVTGDQGDHYTANNTRSENTTVNATIDLTVYNTSDNPNDITLGQGNVVYTVNTYNYSTSKATNPVLTLTLPASSTYVSHTVDNGGTCTQSGSTLTCTWPVQNSGGYFTTTVTVTPGVGGTNVLNATITGDQGDPNTANNSQSQSTTVNATIDLAVYTTSDNPNDITLGHGNVVYTVNTYNYSSSKATNPVLTLTLPASSTYVSHTVDSGGTCTQSGSTLTCTWPVQNSGGYFTTTVTVTPGMGGTNTLSASVAADQGDPTPANNTRSENTTVNATIDLAVYSTSDNPNDITLGQGNVTYTIITYNYSTSKATNAVLSLNLPASSTYVSHTVDNGGTCTPAGSVLTCNWAVQNSGGWFTTTVTVTPGVGGTNTLTASVAADQSDPTPANNSRSENTTVNATIDLAVYGTSDNPNDITLGQGNVVYTVHTYNYTTSKATNPVLTLNLPASSTYVSHTVDNGGTCTPAGSVLTCTWALQNYGGWAYTTTVTVTPGVGGTNTLSASVAADQGDHAPANNTRSENTTVNATIDLAVYSTSDTPNDITLNQGNVKYTITTYNYSTSKATNPVLTLNLPASSTYVSHTVDNSGSCTPSGSVLTCNWAVQNSGGWFTTTVTVTPGVGGTNTLSASVAADQGDHAPTNNTRSENTTVNATIDLAVYSTSDAPNDVTLNQGNVKYTITTYNYSTSKATNPVLTLNLPASSTYVSHTVDNSGSCTLSGSVLTCNWAVQNSGGWFTTTVTVTPGVGGTNTLSASVSADQGDPTPANNSRSENTTVNATIDLAVYSTSDAPNDITLNQGNVKYTITTYNYSTSKATNPVLTLNLPASSTYVSHTVDNSGSCTSSGSLLTCNWAVQNSGGWFTTTVTVTPGVAGTNTLSASLAADQGDPTPANNTRSESTTVNATLDLQLGLSDSPDPRVLGAGTVTYSMQTYNATSSKATNFVFTLSLPGTVTYNSSSPSAGGTCSESGGVVTCSWADIAGYSYRTATIVVTPNAAGQISATGTVSATQGDPVPANNSLTVTTNINPGTAPTITSFNPVSGPGGTTVTITGSSFFSSTAVKFNGVAASFTVNNDGTITATVPGTATTGPISITNSVGTSSSAGNFTITPKPDLTIAKTASPSSVATGSPITYTLTVNNTGSGATHNVTVVDTLPAGVSFQSFTFPSGWACTGTSTITCTMGPLAAAAAPQVITIDVTATSSGTTVTNTATVSTTTPEVSTANNSSSAAVSVSGCPSTPPITAPVTVCTSSTGHSANTPSVTNGSYVWTVTNGTITGGQGSNAITFDAGATGPITVAVDVNVGVCATASNSVNVNVSTPTATISASGPTTFCSGGSVTLTASNGQSWLWSTGETTQSIAVNTNQSITVQVTDAAGCSATSAATVVTVNPAAVTPNISATGPTNFCAGGSVTLVSSESTGNQWKLDGAPISGATAPNFVASTAGSYTVVHTDGNGCSAESAATPIVVNTPPAPPSISADGPLTFCAGQDVVLTAPSSNGYLWSNGATTQSITVTASGTFDVQISNASGCLSGSSAPVTVTVDPAPPAPAITAAGPTSFCAGGSVVLAASGADSWLWSNGATTQSITVTASGTYTVQAFNAANCASSQSAPVTVTVDPMPATPTITASGPTTFCVGDSVTLSAPAAAGYVWSNGATSQSITVSASGTFAVQVTNGSGCQSPASAPVTVTVDATPPAPIITAGGPTTFCAGDSVVLSATNADSWLWSNGATTQSITVTASETFTVQAFSVAGCASPQSSPVSVSVEPMPATPTITTSGPTSFCPGGSVVLTASTADGWLWSNGATTQSITVTASGTFTVQAVSAAGCASPQSTPVTVSVDPAPATPAITASGPTTFCSGGSVTLSAPPSSSYVWSNGETSQSIIVNASGTFTVQVAGANGCQSSTSAPVTVTVNPAPAATITAGGPTSFCGGGSVTLTASAGDAWLWSDGSATRSITVSAGGSYSVQVTSGGCSTESASTTVSVNPAPVVNITGPNASCANAPVVLDAGPGTSWVWNTGATSQQITVSPATTATYSVTVTDGSGCSASDTHTVNVSATPTPTITAPAAVCENAPGNSASIPSQPGATYAWTIANGTITSATNTNAIAFTAGPSGQVSLGVTVTTGTCVGSGNVQIPVSTYPTVAISGPSATCPDAPLTLSVPATYASYLWSTGDQSPSITVSQSAAVQTYTVTVTNAGGCAATATHTVSLSGQPDAAINAPISAPPFSSQTASVPSQPGATFVWAIFNGTITSGQGTSAIEFTTGSTGVTNLTVEVTASGCTTSNGTSIAIGDAPPPSCANQPPSLTAPADGASLTSPALLQWTAVSGATTYDVVVNGTAAGSTGLTSLSIALPSGSYSWHVVARLGGNCAPLTSASRSFVVPGTGPADPCATRATASPLAPANNSTALSSSVIFRWSPAFGASGYRIWASINGADFAVLGSIADTSLTTTIERGLVIWYAEALYEGCPSTESERFRFTIPAAQNCGTARPAPVSPANDAVVTSGSVTFQWSSVAGALGYEVYLALENGTPALIGTTTSATSLTHEVPPGTLQWFVRVLVDRCPSRDSQVSSFTFAEPPTCEPGQRPVPVAPLDDVRTTSPLNFSWSASAGATKYELFVVRGNSAPQLVATTAVPQAVNVALQPGRLAWFVRASFGQGCASLDSSEQALEIVPSPAACTPLASPEISAPGQISAGAAFLVQWSPVAGASAYQLELAEDGSFANAQTVDTTAAQHPLTPANDSADVRAIHARVRAVDGRCANLNVSAFSPPAAIFVLPRITNEGAAPLSNPTPLTFSLVLAPEYAGQSFSAVAKQPWLSVAPSSGVVGAAGTTLSVLADTEDLPVGTSLGAISVTLTSAANGIAANSTSTVTSGFSVSLVTPVSYDPRSTPPPDALIIPAVAHADGINSKFQSDVRVSNTSAQLIKYQLTFTPSGESGLAQSQQSTFSIEPGATIALDDILRTWFGTGTGGAMGTLEVRPLTETQTATSGLGGLSSLVSFASSRTFNVTANGTFGQYIPAIPFANFIGRERILSLQQIAQSTKYRTNLGLLEASGNPVSLSVRVFGDAGQYLTDFPVSLKGGQHLQLNAFLRDQGISALHDGRVEVEVVSGTGKVTAYASVLDNDTSDPLLVTPVTIDGAGGTKWVVPGVADLVSGFANWQTDTRLFNAGTEPVEATLSFYSQGGGEPKVKTLTIGAGQVQQFDRTLASLFGTANDAGALHIATANPSKLIATARTYNQTSTGTYGQFISAVTPAEAAGTDSRPLQLLQVEETDRFRSNVGFVEVTGNPARLEISVVPPDAKFTAVTELDLAPNEFRQLGSLLRSMGLADTYNARITVRVIEGQGRVTAYASVIDMQTNDPTYVPAQ